MKEASSHLPRRIAERVKDLRAARALSLEDLAQRCGVSRSMISLIERGESSPTAVVLEKLAAGLGVTLASLFDAPERPTAAASGPVARRSDQIEWKDPGSGYVRRNVTPVGAGQPMRIVEVHFPAGARVGFEAESREAPIHQQVWILEGSMDVTTGKGRHRLKEGDCLAMELDGPTMFHNPTRRRARYAVVIASEPRGRR
ncbi:MAG TPA: XRE family transcriptional regulator [Candidatus Polarisedimenticolaceae bacterium]